VSWSSKKNPTLSLSSIEVEYKNLCAKTCEVVWLRIVLQDVGEKQKKAKMIRCDNESSIKLKNNSVYHARTKHVDA